MLQMNNIYGPSLGINILLLINTIIDTISIRILELDKK